MQDHQPDHTPPPSQPWEALASPGHVRLAHVRARWARIWRLDFVVLLAAIVALLFTLYVSTRLHAYTQRAAVWVSDSVSTVGADRPAEQPVVASRTPAAAWQPVPAEQLAALAAPAEVREYLQAQAPEVARSGLAAIADCDTRASLGGFWSSTGSTGCRAGADGRRFWVWGLMRAGTEYAPRIQPALLVYRTSPSGVTLTSITSTGIPALPGIPAVPASSIRRALGADFPELR